MHLNRLVAVAHTLLAPSAFGVERESSGFPSAYLRFRQPGEQVAYVVEHIGVGGRVGTGCTADGRLVHIDHFVDMLHAVDALVRQRLHLAAEEFLPEDFVIATGVQHTVREFASLAFHYAGIELEWSGEGIDEKGIVVKGPEKLIGKTVVAVSEDFYRPTDVVHLLGDPSKAKRELGWNPTKTKFEELVALMVNHDMHKVAVERAEEFVKKNLAESAQGGVDK